MPHYQRLDFKWVPGQAAIDQKALERMRENFPKPAKLPPVAWFMSGIEYYNNVLSFPEMGTSDIDWYLSDTGIGISAFGRLKIWVDWFHYMLPYLIEKSLECGTKSSYLFYPTVDFFYRLYPHEIHQEYIGFIHDLFPTFMNTIMHECYWKDGDLKKPEWAEGLDDYRPEWYSGDGPAPVEECLQFCIKYLPEPDIPLWVESVAVIEGEVWQLQVKYWLKRFKKSPLDYYVPEDRAKLFLDELRKYPNYEDI